VDLVGLVFIGQGLGIIPGSVMTGDLFWAAVGVLMIGVTTVYLAWPQLRRR
jgi:hypothetical protein